MKITPGKGKATGYSDFYKGSGPATSPGNKLQGDAASGLGSRILSGAAFRNRNSDDEDENDDDRKKLAIKRRLAKKVKKV